MGGFAPAAADAAEAQAQRGGFNRRLAPNRFTASQLHSGAVVRQQQSVADAERAPRAGVGCWGFEAKKDPVAGRGREPSHRERWVAAKFLSVLRLFRTLGLNYLIKL